MFHKFDGRKRELQIIGYFLLSNYTSVSEAFHLQLVAIKLLDGNTRGMKAMYRFSEIRYFDNFREQKLFACAS